jgi:ankyrin repeat protein
MQTLSRQDAADRSRVFHIATGNSLGELREFIDAAGDINTTTHDGNTLLHCACYNPNPGTVRFLLEQGAAVDARNKWWETPLHVACRLGHERVSFMLLKCSADINARDGSGRTPLNWACRSGSLDTVNLLLSRGADPEISDDYGSTPVEYAAALGPDKTRRGQIVGSFFRYGFGVKKVVMTPGPSGLPEGRPLDTLVAEFPTLS